MSFPVEKKIDRMFALISKKEMRNNTRLAKRIAKIRAHLAILRKALRASLNKHSDLRNYL